MTKFERMNNNMLGNITVGIVIVLAVAACGLGVWLDRAKSDSQDNNTDAQPKINDKGGHIRLCSDMTAFLTILHAFTVSV